MLNVNIAQPGKGFRFMAVGGIGVAEVFLQFHIRVLCQIQLPDALIIAEEGIANGGQLRVGQRRAGKGETAALTSTAYGDPVRVHAVHARYDFIQQRRVQKNVAEQKIIRIIAFQPADDMPVMGVSGHAAHILAFSALAAHIQRRHGKACRGQLHQARPIAGRTGVSMKLQHRGNGLLPLLGNDPFGIDPRLFCARKIQIKAIKSRVPIGGRQGHGRIDGIHFSQSPIPIGVKIGRLGIGSLILIQLWYR